MDELFQDVAHAIAARGTHAASPHAGAFGSKIDLGLFSGYGNEEPLGLINDDSVSGDVAFGGAPTAAKITEIMADVADAGGDNDNVGVFVTSPTARKKLMDTERAAGNGFLWDAVGPLGRKGLVTTNVVGHRLIFGNFNDMAVVFFGGAIEITADRISAAKSHQVVFHVHAHIDYGPLRAASFAKSGDSSAQ